MACCCDCPAGCPRFACRRRPDRWTPDATYSIGSGKMSVFGNIMSSIFGGATAAKPVAAQPPSPMDAQAPTAPPSVGSAAPPRQVDVAAIMDQLAGSSREELDWRKSIVDLLKLLKLDSSLAARKQLAEELHYPGSMKDSAAM
ncbi:MAG: DUF3597 domain-containing protein, partial [Hyphomicrobiaceae bacterium]